MSDQLELAAEARERVGKGASRALRRDGRVPAVIYGQNQTPTTIHLEEKALNKALGTGHFMTSLVMIDGLGGAAIRTLPKDVTFHPVSERPVHVDFLRVGEHTAVTVRVPVVIVGQDQSPGIAAGGVLNVVEHELELIVDAADIPAEVAVSVAGLEAGASIHLSDMALPNGAKPAHEDRDVTIATIVAATAPTAADDAADREAGVPTLDEALAAPTNSDEPEADAPA